jgi:predicted transcriptional regulator
MERLTMQEEEAMRWIWQIAPCYVKDVLAKYSEPKPPYTTLASIIKNLERKKYVKAVQQGNTYEYTPLIGESEYKRSCEKLF